jgi:hypothetical protein
VIGVVLIVIVVLIALPVAFWATWGAMAVVLGWLLTNNAELTHPGSELIDTNI